MLLVERKPFGARSFFGWNFLIGGKPIGRCGVIFRKTILYFEVYGTIYTPYVHIRDAVPPSKTL